jgi:uncharacterized protein YpmB
VNMKKKVIIICLAIFIVMLLSISSIFIIKNINKMYKNREHLFNDKGKLINEKEYISTFFEKKP